MAFLDLVANFTYAFGLFRIRNGNQIDLLTCTCPSSGLPKTISFQSFLQISVVFSNCSKALSNLDSREDL
jgi:hypothetical protein